MIPLAADIPNDTGGPYVVAAYVVFLVLIAIYVAIMAQRLTKISKTAAELEARLAHVQGAGAGAVQGDVHTTPGATPTAAAPSASTASAAPSPSVTS
jgi:type II secretory pathway component PulM